VLNATAYSINEGLDVVDLLRGVLEEVLSVLVDPLSDRGVQFVDKSSRANFEPANIMNELLAVNLVLDAMQEFDFLVKACEIRLLSSHILEDLHIEILIFLHRLLHFGFKLFLVFAGVPNPLLCLENLLEPGSRPQEFLESLIDIFLPEEVPGAVLVQEVLRLLRDLIEIARDLLHCAEQYELIFDFHEEVTSRIWVFIIQTRYHNSNRDKIVNDVVDNITDTVFSRVAVN